MTENRYWNLLAKKLAGDAGVEELQELESLVRSHPEWHYSTEFIENIWKSKHDETSSYDSEIAFELHLDNLKKNGVHIEHAEPLPLPLSPPTLNLKSSKKIWALSLTAICILAVVLWAQFYTSTTSPRSTQEKAYSEVSTRFGSKTRMVLPDSSVVWLNAGSKLTYNEHFGITNRNTTLTGEAYFDVKKSTIPFTIIANGLHIKVLGTAFNVRSYPDEKNTETSLIRGRVEVTHDKRPGEIFILKPNEKLVIANEPEQKQENLQKTEPKVVLSSLTHTPDNTIVETSWVDNKLVFQDESFEEVAKRMEKWYNIRINIKDEQLSQVRLGGTFENENIRQALDALRIAAPFNYTINENTILITR
jgi:ferric-dicitrate binding protein FerR (iron transport regulator)